jgi:hypothetical protein
MNREHFDDNTYHMLVELQAQRRLVVMLDGIDEAGDQVVACKQYQIKGINHPFLDFVAVVTGALHHLSVGHRSASMRDRPTAGHQQYGTFLLFHQGHRQGIG